MPSEPLTSRRLRVINFSIGEIYDDVGELSEALVDKQAHEALVAIEGIRNKLTLLKEQIINGDITD